MAAAAGVLTTAVDAVVAEDLAGLTVEQLKAYVSLAPQVQLLSGFPSAPSSNRPTRR